MKIKYFFNRFLIILFLIVTIAGCSAQKSSEKMNVSDSYLTNESKREGVEKLLTLWFPKSMIDQMYSQINQTMLQYKQQLNVKPSEDALFDEFMLEINSILKSTLTWGEMKDPIISVLSKHFSKKEIKDMVNFYESDVMQALKAEMPASMLLSEVKVNEFMLKRAFTSEENEYVLSFNSSKTGQAMRKKMPVISQDLMLQSEKKMKKLLPKLQKIKNEFEGNLAAFRMSPKRTLWWVDRNGNETKINAPSYGYFYPNISPDGTKVVMTVNLGKNRNIYILDLTQGTTQRMTTASNNIYIQPIWSPDGTQIAYSSGNGMNINMGGKCRILSKAVNSAGEPKKLVSSSGKWNLPHCWKNDGSLILTAESGPRFDNFDIGMISLDGKPSYVLILSEDYHETQPQLSPDGQWLAYCTTESGKTQIYVSPFPDVDKGKWQISIDEGNSPRWSPDGKELYYLIGSNYIEAVMMVKVETKPTFSPGKPELLFRGGMYLGPLPGNGIPYDVHPDGQRFLMMKEY